MSGRRRVKLSGVLLVVKGKMLLLEGDNVYWLELNVIILCARLKSTLYHV